MILSLFDFFATYPDFLIGLVGFISLFIGSFLNVVIYRLPLMLQKTWADECRNYLNLTSLNNNQFNLSLPLSHCPKCKTNIKPWHNIPIVSFLLLKGRCAYCDVKIAWRYPFVELLSFVLSIFLSWYLGWSPQLFAALIYTWIIICLIFIDIDYHLLPDQLTLLLLWLGLFFSLFNIFCTPTESILGAILGYSLFAGVQFVFKKMTGKIGLGQGDYKLLAACGAFVGWQQLPFIILFSSLTGIIITLIRMSIKRNFTSVPFAFGPYLGIAGWFAMLWGDSLLQYYLSLI